MQNETFILTFWPISDRAAAQLEKTLQRIDPNASVMSGWTSGRRRNHQPGYIAVPADTDAGTIVQLRAIAERALQTDESPEDIYD